MPHLSPRRIVAATAVVALITTGAIAEVGVEDYIGARDSAYLAWFDTSATVHALASAVSEQQAAVAEEVRSAQTALQAASGHTLTSAAPQAVSQAIGEVRGAAAQLDRQVLQAKLAFASADAAFERTVWWPPTATSIINAAAAQPSFDEVDSAVEALSASLVQLDAAESAWRAQFGIPDPPSPIQIGQVPEETVISGQTRTGFDLERYLLTLVRDGVSVVWDLHCEAGRICGETAIGETTPVIHLDEALRPYYSTQAGLYVLTHEAAHAQSWYLYHSLQALMANSETVTGITSANGLEAVEWMADCATIAKIGVVISSYAYTSDCTPAELAEGARYWR